MVPQVGKPHRILEPDNEEQRIGSLLPVGCGFAVGHFLDMPFAVRNKADRNARLARFTGKGAMGLAQVHSAGRCAKLALPASDAMKER